MNMHRFKLGDIQLSAHVQGEGRPLVLVHGFPFDWSMWEHQIDALAQHAQVIVPNLRGFGDSTLADDDVARGVAMSDYADDVVRLLDNLGIDQPVVLAGFSMGGYVAWQFALGFPSRLAALLLCDTRAAADAPDAQVAREQMAQDCLNVRSSEPALAMMPKLLAADTIAHRPELVEKVRGMIERCSHRAIAAAQRGMARREDVRSRLGQIDLPALCLVGRHDAISPLPEMQDMAATLPQGELIEISGAGHMTPLENPDAVTDAIVEFLQRLA